MVRSLLVNYLRQDLLPLKVMCLRDLICRVWFVNAQVVGGCVMQSMGAACWGEGWEHVVWERTAYALDGASESNSKMQPLSGGKNLKAFLDSEFDYVTNYHCDLRKASSPFWSLVFLICQWVAGHMAAQLTSWLPVACLGTVLGCALSQGSFDSSRHTTDSVSFVNSAACMYMDCSIQLQSPSTPLHDPVVLILGNYVFQTPFSAGSVVALTNESYLYKTWSQRESKVMSY